jgi:hypothetical protein
MRGVLCYENDGVRPKAAVLTDQIIAPFTCSDNMRNCSDFKLVLDFRSQRFADAAVDQRAASSFVELRFFCKLRYVL